jgi:hypothetical protein
MDVRLPVQIGLQVVDKPSALKGHGFLSVPQTLQNQRGLQCLHENWISG